MISKEKKRALIVGAAVLLGIAAVVFFYAHPIGLNLILYILLSLGAAVGFVVAFRARVLPVHALLILPILFFAAMFALISAPFLTAFNSLLLFGLLLTAIQYGTQDKLFFTDTWEDLLGEWFLGVLGFVTNPLFVLDDSKDWLLTARLRLKREQAAQVRAVGRGCLITIPILLFFGALLASADFVFSDFLVSLVSWIEPPGMGLIEQIGIFAVFAWASSAWLDMLLIDRTTLQETKHNYGWLPQSPAPASEGLPPDANSLYGTRPMQPPQHVYAPKPAKPLRLGMIESSMILGSVNFLFLVFVIIQTRYFFGGQSNINSEGYTYAEYARRGFFELVAVSIFTMLLIVILDHITTRAGRQARLFQGLAVGLIVLTLVMLVSAFRRMGLYEDAYGFTRLRVFTHVFMVWLAILFLTLIADLFRLYPRLFWIGCMVTTLGFFATLNLMNVDGFIADRNVDRYYDTGKIDIEYLVSLSDDAVPAMVLLVDDQNLSEADSQLLHCDLSYRLMQLDDRHDASGFFGYHRNHERAWDRLNERRDDLVYEPICSQRYPNRYEWDF